MPKKQCCSLWLPILIVAVVAVSFLPEARTMVGQQTTMTNPYTPISPASAVYTYGPSSITVNGYYHYSYIPSGAQVFWLVTDSGQKYQLIFASLGSPNLPNRSPLRDGSHITVTGTLKTPSASTGYDGDIAVSSSGGICYLTSSSGEISPCLYGTCDPSRGIYCPTPAETATVYPCTATWAHTGSYVPVSSGVCQRIAPTNPILDELAKLWNWLRCLFGYCS